MEENPERTEGIVKNISEQKRHNLGAERRPKRTISKTFRSMGGFCGWNKIEDTHDSIAEPETRQIFNGIYELGCRAMELPLLTRGQVDLTSSDTWIRIRGMYVLKQKEVLYLQNTDGTPLLRADGKKKYTFNSIEFRYKEIVLNQHQ